MIHIFVTADHYGRFNRGVGYWPQHQEVPGATAAKAVSHHSSLVEPNELESSRSSPHLTRSCSILCSISSNRRRISSRSPSACPGPGWRTGSPGAKSARTRANRGLRRSGCLKIRRKNSTGWISSTQRMSSNWWSLRSNLPTRSRLTSNPGPCCARRLSISRRLSPERSTRPSSAFLTRATSSLLSPMLGTECNRKGRVIAYLDVTRRHRGPG